MKFQCTFVARTPCDRSSLSDLDCWMIGHAASHCSTLQCSWGIRWQEGTWVGEGTHTGEFQGVFLIQGLPCDFWNWLMLLLLPYKKGSSSFAVHIYYICIYMCIIARYCTLCPPVSSSDAGSSSLITCTCSPVKHTHIYVHAPLHQCWPHFDSPITYRAIWDPMVVRALHANTAPSRHRMQLWVAIHAT